MKRVCEYRECPHSLDGRRPNVKYCDRSCQQKEYEARCGDGVTIAGAKAFWDGYGLRKAPVTVS